MQHLADVLGIDTLGWDLLKNAQVSFYKHEKIPPKPAPETEREPVPPK